VQPYYQDEAVTVYCAPCETVLSWLGPVDAVITDPPYGVGLTEKVMKGHRITASSTYADTEASILPNILAVVAWAKASAKRAVITTGVRLVFSYPKPDAMGCIYCPVGAGRDAWGFGCFHPILYYGKCPYLAKGLGSRPNSFSSTHPGMHVTKEQWDHPCPKPIEWMRWLVNRGSLPGETLLDPFAGTGTTGIAARELGRKAILIEQEEQYCAIIVQRLRQTVIPVPALMPVFQESFAFGVTP
jgi:site-specific DNA-methyltransferase (adenine-specific)